MSYTTNKYLKEHETPLKFERFLEDKCFEENPQVLDDDMPNFFVDWQSQLDVEELIVYGDQFGQFIYDDMVNGMQEVII